MAARNDSLFGTANFLSSHMRALGHEAIDIHANNRPLQEAWMAEHHPGCMPAFLRAARHLAPGKIGRYLIGIDPLSPRFYQILDLQIRAFRPNIIYNFDPAGVPASRLKALLPRDCALVGQIASPRNPATDWRAYDLVISSLPNFITDFRREGVTAEYLRLAFERTVLDRLSDDNRNIPLSFVGSITSVHSERTVFLEALARDNAMSIWGEGTRTRPSASPIHACYRGVAWGREMYAILHRSRLTLNKHIDVSGPYANNLRLYEATGTGVCLVTDWKENLDELFETGKEVVAYRSAEECLDLLRYYGTRPEGAERIARAGQLRCLHNHSYDVRMVELSRILTRHFQ
jgi:hypothetical protein